METKVKPLELRCLDFSHNGHIPRSFTCDGEDYNPSLEVGKIPEGTATLALLMEDPDAPGGIFVHWVLWNHPPASPIQEKTKEGVNGSNDFGRIGYGGPCPPSGTHRYYFRVYALDSAIDLPAGSDKNALMHAIKDHVLATGEIMGRYTRSKK